MVYLPGTDAARPPGRGASVPVDVQRLRHHRDGEHPQTASMSWWAGLVLPARLPSVWIACLSIRVLLMNAHCLLGPDDPCHNADAGHNKKGAQSWTLRHQA